MMQFKEFPIGFWACYYPGFKWTREEVARWKECGLTFAMTPFYNPGSTDKAEFLAAMDACAEMGISLIVCDTRARVQTYKNAPEEYRKTFQEAVNDFGYHPATLGFFIGDEPYGEAILPCQEVCNIQLEVAPHLMPYVNFLPYDGLKDCGYNTQGKTFAQWIDDFAKESNCPAFSYDCYVQMNPEKEWIHNFFANLYHYTKAAKRNDRALFCIALGVGHFRYRVPNQNELRWQFNAAVATGCSGVFWFTFYNNYRYNNYRGAAIDEFGKETQTYGDMARLHKRFLRDYGKIINTSKHLDTFCIGKEYGGYGFFRVDIPVMEELGIAGAQSLNGTPGLLSIFENEKGEKFVMIFNNSYDNSDRFHLVLNGNVKKVWRLYNDQTVDFEKSHWDAYFVRGKHAVEAGVWLEPGGFDLFKLEY